MDAELAQLVAAAEGVTRPSRLPSAVPVNGQSLEEWRSEVDRLRQQHNAAGLEARQMAGRSTFDGAIGSVRYIDVEVTDALLGARVYTPVGDPPFPAVLFLHGGAWWQGGGANCFAGNDALCRRICAGAGAVVVNLDYRLAPEYRFPVQLEDSYETVNWIIREAKQLGVDEQRVVVAGGSSGGHAAAGYRCSLATVVGPSSEVSS